MAYNIPYEFWSEDTMRMVLNTHFFQDVKSRFKKEDILLLMCRSGNRSPKGSKLLIEAGFLHVFNVEGGFEGRKDPSGHRTVNGWKVNKLPYAYKTDPGHGYRYPAK